MSSRPDRQGTPQSVVAACLASQIVRFGIVSVIGVAVDLATGWVLSAWAKVPLTLAAFIGFAVAAGLNYVLHASWTFAGATASPPARRGGLYLLTIGVTLATRLGVVAILQGIVPSGPLRPLLALAPAIGVSFTVNFLLNKLLVFRGAPTRRADGPAQY